MVCATVNGPRSLRIAMGERSGGEAFDFEDFTRQQYDAVLAYLLARTRNLALAQDLAQETFLQAFRSRRSYDPARAKALDWVIGIARHVSAYAARRQGARAHKMSFLESIAEKAWLDHEADFEEDARLAALRKCLEILTERARQIIDSLYESGMTYAQVAEQLGMGIGAVKVAAFRARQALLECVRRRLDAARGPS